MTAEQLRRIEEAYDHPDEATLKELCRAHIRAREDCEEAQLSEMQAGEELAAMEEAYKECRLELERVYNRRWWQRLINRRYY